MELILLEVLLIFALLIVNGVFSMSELAVVSARRIRLQQQAEKGDRGALAALELAENPSNFLSTVQIGITLVGILAGAFGGATIAGILGDFLKSVPVVAPYAATIAFALVVAVITYFSIVIGELIPKSLALNSPEKIASVVARPMRLISSVAAPFVWLLSVPTSFVLKIFRVRATVEPPVTDEEIKGLIDAGTKAGVFEKSEKDLIESVIGLGDQRVTSVMTPRTKIAWLDLDDSPEEIRGELVGSRFSRLPVARGRIDNIVGYATAKALLGHFIEKGELDLQPVLRAPFYVPETLTILELLEQFRESHTHFAIVVDEFGGVEGLVTINDVLEAIVGELPNSQHVLPEHGVSRRHDGAFVLDGRLPVLDFKDVLELKNLPDDEQDFYQTLAGFILFRLGKVPAIGETFAWDKYRFEVVSMEQNRIDKVLVELISPENSAEKSP
ncbi:MAG TPA: hemolysin family protein [Pyrinomonadaceae bacterium]|jgi:putative hemolysin